MEYLFLKTVHILSATLLFGTGLGSAYYKFISDRAGVMQNIYMTNRHVVIADWCFTTPAIILQPVTGMLLAAQAGYPLTSFWLVTSIILYFIAGFCWLPVVVLQIRMREISKFAYQQGRQLPEKYNQYAKTWFYLGIPAFIAIIGVYFMMVFKPSW